MRREKHELEEETNNTANGKTATTAKTKTDTTTNTMQVTYIQLHTCMSVYTHAYP